MACYILHNVVNIVFSVSRRNRETARVLGRLGFRRRRDSSSAKLRREWTASRRTPHGRKNLAPARGPLGRPAVYFERRSWEPISGSAAAAAAKGRWA